MDYLLKSSGLIVLLYLFYYIFLRNETFFKSIRGYFFIGLLLALLIPLIEIPIYVEKTAIDLSAKVFSESISSTTTNDSANYIDWAQLAVYAYMTGVGFFLLKFISALLSLVRLVMKHPKTKDSPFLYIKTNTNSSPFSFFNIIVYNPNLFSEKELQQIITHEKAHVLQWHTVDTLLSHVLVIVLWFNPFVWLYKKAVQQNLEYLADSFAVETTSNKKLYQLTMLKTSTTNYCTAITNNFYNSLIKKRIVMLHKNHSKKRSQWKYLLVLPLMAAFILNFNTKVVAQETTPEEEIVLQELRIDLIIDKNSTDKNLSENAAVFKKELDIAVSFSGVKRNAKNEITAIKIDAKGKDVRAKFENAGTKPISPIKISYNKANNALHIGNVGKKHKMHTYAYSIHDSHDKKGKEGKKHKKIMIVSPDGDTQKHMKKIHINSNADNVWISKDDDKEMEVEVIELDEGKQKIKIIQKGKDIHFEDDVEVIEEKDGEKIFIIKKVKGDKSHAISTKSGNVFFMDKPDDALIFIDGKESTPEALEKLSPNDIKTIDILKGEAAVEKYGKKAKKGVVRVITKKN